MSVYSFMETPRLQTSYFDVVDGDMLSSIKLISAFYQLSKHLDLVCHVGKKFWSRRFQKVMVHLPSWTQMYFVRTQRHVRKKVWSRRLAHFILH